MIITSDNEVTLEKQDMHESLAVTLVDWAVLQTIFSKFCSWPLWNKRKLVAKNKTLE